MRAFFMPSNHRKTSFFTCYNLIKGGGFVQEELKKRLQELELQMRAAQIKSQQAIAEINAIGGAIQEVKYWMEKLKPENAEVEG